MEAALASSAHVVSDTFRTAGIEHAYLEPESSLAVPQHGKGPRMHVLSQGQGAWEDRRQIASLLGWEQADVLVTQVATGGAFGGKEDLNVQGHAALLALAVDRPVLLALSQTAHDALSPAQRARLSHHAELLPLAIPTIETIGGGSVRCMLAEVFLPEIGG